MGDETELEIAPFGRLRYGREYGVEYWRGAIALSSFEQAFALTVRAGRSGPSPRQVAAMTRLAASAVAIHRQATGPMAELHRRSGLCSLAGEDAVWSVLRPEEIEVSDERYLGDGRIAVLLIFVSTLEPGFAPAIETADGEFRHVLSGS